MQHFWLELFDLRRIEHQPSQVFLDLAAQRNLLLLREPMCDELVVEPCRLNAARIVADHDIRDTHAAPRLTDDLFRDGADDRHIFSIEELIDRL